MAKTVSAGTMTEREIELERQLKSREEHISKLEDENHRLKSPPAPAPLATPAAKRSWLDGATFFE